MKLDISYRRVYWLEKRLVSETEIMGMGCTSMMNGK
jgi:hypothetical protein